MIIPQWIKKAIRSFNPPALVLMYHRVAEPLIDPWQLAVSPNNFEQQLQVLRASGLVVPISHLVEQLNTGKLKSPSIVITFDDGYVDNYLHAKPLLEKYDLPATFFISTGHIGKNKEFWWDELTYLFLQVEKLPADLNFCINEMELSYNLENEEVLIAERFQELTHWNYTQGTPSQRTKIYMELWKILSPLTYQVQQTFIKELKLLVGVQEQGRKDFFSMSESQLADLAARDIFTLGAHTVSHPAMAYHPVDMQYKEIAQSRKYLEEITASNINVFAYPSGNFNKTTVSLLKQQNISAAFTTQQKSVRNHTNPYQVGRFQVNNWTGEKFNKMLSWFFNN